MTSTLSITVRGRAKPTPRLEGAIRWRGGSPFVHMFTPDTADAWKLQIRRAFEPHWPEPAWDGPVVLDVILWVPRMADQYGSAWPSGAFPCIAPSMGDWDNLGKAISDALNPVKEERDALGRLKRMGQPGVWLDDRQVFDGRVRKFHHGRGAAPGALVVVTHWSEQMMLHEPHEAEAQGRM